MKCPYCSETITEIKYQYLDAKPKEFKLVMRDKPGMSFAKLCPSCDKILAFN